MSRRYPDVVWTHIDERGFVYAVDAGGRVLGAFPLGPREPADDGDDGDWRDGDWEDMEIATCGPRASCLYFADTGDNQERRPDGSARIVRVPEPDPSAPGPLEADVFPIRLPDGPRDIEAMFVLPGERVHLITKGRQDALTVYRYPSPLRPDTVTLEEVQRLSTGPRSLLSQVTGASASPDGSVVAVRTYQSLEFFGVQADTLARRPNGLVNLRSLEEIQGEAVAVGADGRVVLTSEGGPLGDPASMRVLTCQVDGA